MNYIVGGTVITLIGSNVLNTLITATIGVVFSSANFLHHGIEINKMMKQTHMRIESMDIPIKLRLVQKLLETLPKKETISILEDGLIDLMFKIKSLLEWITYEIDTHNSKWFSSYRNLDTSSKLDDLEHLIKILDCRINLLMNSNL